MKEVKDEEEITEKKLVRKLILEDLNGIRFTLFCFFLLFFFFFSSELPFQEKELEKPQCTNSRESKNLAFVKTNNPNGKLFCFTCRNSNM